MSRGFQFPVSSVRSPGPPRDGREKYPDFIPPQLQVPQLLQPIQPLDPRDLILHKVEIGQVHQMRHVLDMLDLVKAQVQTRQSAKVVQALDVRNQVIVQIEIDDPGGDFARDGDSRYLVLAEAESLFVVSLHAGMASRVSQDGRRT